jgi:hypothetical protein
MEGNHIVDSNMNQSFGLVWNYVWFSLKIQWHISLKSYVFSNT